MKLNTHLGSFSNDVSFVFILGDYLGRMPMVNGFSLKNSNCFFLLPIEVDKFGLNNEHEVKWQKLMEMVKV